MPLENADYISELNPLWPLGSDGVNTSDDHHRNTKKAVQQSFPNITAEVTATQDDLNTLTGAATEGSGLNPVGTVLQGAWAAAPNGYLPCDGSAIDAEHTELITLVGANTPDLQGMFIRGTSPNTDVDPDGPRVALDVQAMQLEDHKHTVDGNTDESGTGNIPTTADGSGTATSFNTRTQAAAETRPVNTALMYVIKW